MRPLLTIHQQQRTDSENTPTPCRDARTTYPNIYYAAFTSIRKTCVSVLSVEIVEQILDNNI